MKENTERLEKETATVLQQNKHLMESLQKPMQELSELQKQLTNYNKIKASLVVSICCIPKVIVSLLLSGFFDRFVRNVRNNTVDNVLL